MATVRPLDSRLLREAKAARGYVILTAALGLVTAGLVVAQALLLAHVLAPLITGSAELADVVPKLVALAVVFTARAAVVGIQECFAHRAATRTISHMRSDFLELTEALR